MALSQAALCEISDVETALSLTPAAQDALLTRLIEAASARINTYCGRTFHRTDEISEYVRSGGWSHLMVSRPPVLTVDWVKYDGSAIDSDSYECVGDHVNQGVIFRPNGWTWTEGYLSNISEDYVPDNNRLLHQVQYDGGYVTANQVTLTTFATRTLPYEIEQAAIDLVSYLYHRQGADPRIQKESVGKASIGYSDAGQLGTDMPEYIRAPLAAYKMVKQA